MGKLYRRIHVCFRWCNLLPGCMPKLQGCYYESRFKAKLKAKKNKLSHLLQNLVTTLQHNCDQFLVRNCNSFQPIKLQ